jgi:glycosyltransferase involved in cell wall biosynthesis
MVSEPLRIVVVIPFDPYYQPFTIRTIMFCRHLTARGHEVHLFYLPLAEGKRTVRVHEAPLGRFAVSPLVLSELAPAVARADVVHLQKAFPRAAGPALLLARRYGKPVHYDWDDDDLAFCLDKARDAAAELAHGGRGIARLGKAMGGAMVLGLLESALPRLADTVGAASMALRARCASLGVPAAALFPAPVGVDADVFCPTARDPRLREQLGLEGPTVVYSGYFDLAQDLAWFVESLAALRERAPAVRTLVVGAGSGRAQLAALLGRRGLGTLVVQTPGFVPFADMPRWLASCELAAIPLRDTPRNRSKSSLTAMECMACALPVVTHAVGDMPWILGETGVILRDSHPVAFAAAIAELATDAARRARLGAAARERARTRFRWELTVDQLERAYRTAIAAHGARGHSSKTRQRLASS